MFCGLQYRIVRRWGARGCMRRKRKPKPHQSRDEVQLNCVSLRPGLDYEVAWSAVKGQDERQKTAPLTALHATREAGRDRRKKSTTIRRGRHVGLDFYDLLIVAGRHIAVARAPERQRIDQRFAEDDVFRSDQSFFVPHPAPW